MINKSDVLVLLSTYNSGNFLREQLDSLFRQSYRDFRILVRDDGSTDGTTAILKEEEARRPESVSLLDEDGERLGPAKSFMRLLEKSDGGYYFFCDQDDVWLPDKIEKSMGRMKAMEERYGSEVPLLVFGDLSVVGEDLAVLHESFFESQRLDPRIASDWRKLAAQNVVAGCTMLINRAAKDVCLPFPDIGIMYDQWIALQVARHGRTECLREPVVLYRQHGTNSVGTKAIRPGYFFGKFRRFKDQLDFYRKLSAALRSEITVPRLVVNKMLTNIGRVF